MLRGKDFLSVQDLTAKDILEIFKKARFFKKQPFGRQLLHKTIIMLFAKPSTRTRVSFEVAINNLGGDDIFLPLSELQITRGESVGDTARVLSRYGDGMVARLFEHEMLLQLAAASEVPVINGLTDLLHPCQALTDLFTVQEKIGKLEGVKLSYVGDGNNNVAHSLLHACSLLGVDMSIGCPAEFAPRAFIIEEALKNAEQSGASIRVMKDPRKAIEQADVVYTDTWVSMGEEKEAARRISVFRPYQVNTDFLKHAKRTALVMHDLPAHRGFEITSEVMDGKQSIIFDQAENRLHVEKALLAMIYK